MKLAVLHLSDIHLKDEVNLITGRVERIVAALRSVEVPFDACLIAVTGDIAFSGKATEYSLAETFFSNIKAGVKEIDPTRSVSIVFVPGNHDCDFGKMKADVHAMLIRGIHTDIPELKSDSGVVEQFLVLQEEFFTFEARATGEANQISKVERLFWVKEFECGERKIKVNCYNTAWLSQMKEKQGELYFPTQVVNKNNLLAGNSDLILSLFHHPYGWLQANNSLDFENLIDRSSDIVLTGHEHVEKYTQKRNITGEETNYSKGAVLQETGEDRSGFNIILIDLVKQEQKVFQYAWKEDMYKRKYETDWFQFIRNSALVKGGFENSKEFTTELNEVGANFSHPRAKDNLRLRDIFNYPDFSDRTLHRKLGSTPGAPKLLRGENLLNYVAEHKHILIIGGDVSGKTSLAKVLYSDLKSVKDMVPVLVSGEELDGPEEEKFRKGIGRTFAKQYSVEALENFEQLQPERRALIIDDFNKSKFRNPKTRALILNAAKRLFGVVVVFADELIRIEEIAAGNNAPNPLLDFRHLSIRELSYSLRAKLAEQWIRLGQEHTIDEKEVMRLVSNYEKLFESLFRKNVLYANPLTILVILQSWEVNQSHDMEAGSYGYLWEELITRALRKEGVEPSEIDLKYTFISRIAFYLFNREQMSLSAQEMREVYDDYKRLYKMHFNVADMLRDLEQARILTCIDGNHRFKHKYVYYYFVARYIKENLSNDDEAPTLRNQLSNMADRVHYEEYANILSLYVYRTKDREIIKRLLDNARRIYDEYDPCNLEEDVAFVNRMYKEVPKLELPDTSLNENREEHRQRLDEADESIDELKRINEEHYNTEYKRELSDILKINIAIKTLQVIGQILRNSPGSLRADLKFEITKESYKLGLRTLQVLMTIAETNLDDFRRYFASIIGEKRDIKPGQELLRLADSVIIDLTQGCAYGIIKRISHSVGLEQLSEIYAQVLREEGGDTASLLIDLSIKLDHFSGVPEAEIRNINKKLKDNAFAFVTLRDMVANYLYLSPAEQRARQSLGKLLDIGIKDPKMLMGREQKLLK
jgi:hypothetical protein